MGALVLLMNHQDRLSQKVFTDDRGEFRLVTVAGRYYLEASAMNGASFTNESPERRPDGSMVIPVGGEDSQELLLVRRGQGRVTRERICSCVFVKLLGEEGW